MRVVQRERNNAVQVRPCPCCGVKFRPRHPKTRCCSPKCGQRLRQQRSGRSRPRESTCVGCGIMFQPKSRGGGLKHGTGQYCSRECAFLNHPHYRKGSVGTANAVKKLAERRKTDGERRAVSDGYVLWANSWTACVDCGHQMLLTPSQRTKRCDQCRTSRRVCRDCGAAVGKGKQLCQPCKAAKAKSQKAKSRRKQKWSTNHRKRARHYGVAYEPVKRSMIIERDKWACYLCGHVCRKDAGPWDHDKATVDHVVPLSNGGTHVESNLRCCCWLCNTNKGSTNEPIESLQVRMKSARLRHSTTTQVTSMLS
jgi:hypothetical protein